MNCNLEFQTYANTKEVLKGAKTLATATDLQKQIPINSTK